MSIRGQIKKIVRNILKVFGFDIVPRVYVYDWQTGDQPFPRGAGFLPHNAAEYLRPDHPDLLDLKSRYQQVEGYPSDEALLWTEDRVSPEDLLFFRGHNAYVFQEGRFNRNPLGYLMAYYYTKAIDNYNLLEKLSEDGAFGAISYLIDDRQVSRDLLDSVLELYFLEDHLEIMGKDHLRVLDIGAGYGRLAHRMAEALPNLSKYHCTDAVAISTFICKYYLGFRNLGSITSALPLDQVEGEIQAGSIDLAINIHSFSECTLPVIRWWVALLAEKKVPALMIIPNSGQELLTNDGKNFRPLVEEAGYRLAVVEPKFKDPLVQKYALNPDHFHLYVR